MKKAVLVVVIILGLIVFLWWLGGQDKKTNNELSVIAYDSEIPKTNIDINRLIEAITESATTTESVFDSPIRLFSEKDLVLASSSSEILKEYKKLMQENILLIEKQEPVEARIMLAVFNSKNSAELTKIKESETFFKEMTKKLLTITVPENTVKNHLALLLNTEKISNRLAKMQLILSEPLTALENAQLYHVEILLLNQTLSNTRFYLNSIK